MYTCVTFNRQDCWRVSWCDSLAVKRTSAGSKQCSNSCCALTYVVMLEGREGAEFLHACLLRCSGQTGRGDFSPCPNMTIQVRAQYKPSPKLCFVVGGLWLDNAQPSGLFCCLLWLRLLPIRLTAWIGAGQGDQKEAQPVRGTQRWLQPVVGHGEVSSPICQCQ